MRSILTRQIKIFKELLYFLIGLINFGETIMLLLTMMSQ